MEVFPSQRLFYPNTQKGINLKQFKVDLPESRSEEVLEIAREKARSAFAKLQKLLFVIDGALYIKALNDFPKTYGEMSLKEVREFNNQVWRPTVFDKFIKWFKNI